MKILCLLLLLTQNLQGEPLKVYDKLPVGNKTLFNVKVISVVPNGIRVIHSDGAGLIPFEKLSSDLQRQFGLNKEVADKFTAEQQEQERIEQERLSLIQKAEKKQSVDKSTERAKLNKRQLLKTEIEVLGNEINALWLKYYSTPIKDRQKNLDLYYLIEAKRKLRERKDRELDSLY